MALAIKNEKSGSRSVVSREGYRPMEAVEPLVDHSIKNGRGLFGE